MKAQANILKAITNAYAAYAPVRKVILETVHKRHSHVNALIQSSSLYNQLQEKAVDGLTFYAKLRENVTKLLGKVVAACKVQEEERQQYYEKTGKRPSDKTVKPPMNGLPDTMASPAPKLRDYLNQRKLSAINANDEVSLYNPSYTSQANTQTMNPSMQSVKGSGTDAEMNTFYASHSRPQPYGAENVSRPASVDPAKAVVAATTTLPQYNYNYPYYSSASTYQANTLTQTYTTNAGTAYTMPDSYGKPAYGTVPTGYSTTTYPAYNPYSSKSTSIGQQQSDGYRTAHTPYNTAQMGILQTSYNAAPTTYEPPKASPTPTSYTSHPYAYNTTPQPNQNAYSGAQAANTYSRNVPPQVFATHGAGYNTYYGTNASVVPEAHSTLPYSGGNTNMTSTQTPYTNTGQETAYYNQQMKYGGANYVAHNQNATYSYGRTSVEPVGQNAITPSTISYVNINMGSSTCSATNYTNAGHHNTENIQSSSKSHDGRSYAVQYATNTDDVPASTLSTTSNIQPQQYFSTQYGHQFAITTEGQKEQPHVKQNSMTVMQAGVNGEGTVTMSGSKSSVTSIETMPESNVDLLADLDFSVSDPPLLPLSESTNINRITEELDNIDFNAVDGVGVAKVGSFSYSKSDICVSF